LLTWEPAVNAGRKILLREHMVVGKFAAADVPVLVADTSTIVEIAGLRTGERGHCHGDGDIPYRQVVSGHLADLSTASHAAFVEAAWVAHGALGADGDSSCPKHDMVPVGLDSSEVKSYFESSHMIRLRRKVGKRWMTL
jgi:hypothetical protein